jgi:hypothetical protein
MAARTRRRMQHVITSVSNAGLRNVRNGMSLALLALCLVGCGYAGAVQAQAIRTAAEGAKRQAHGRLAVLHAVKRKTPDGHKVWLVEFRIRPRRVAPWLGGRICALSFSNSGRTSCRTRTTSSTTSSKQRPPRASGRSPALARMSNRTCASRQMIFAWSSVLVHRPVIAGVGCRNSAACSDLADLQRDRIHAPHRPKGVSERRLSGASDDGMAPKAIRPPARFTPDGPGYTGSRCRT